MDFGAAWTYLTHNKGGWLKTGSVYVVSRDGAHVEADVEGTDEIISLTYSTFAERFRVSRFVEVE